MKFLKHTFVVVALLLMAMPCTHAKTHELYAQGQGASAEMCATHTCACHSCDTETCGENLKMPQGLSVATAPIVAPAVSVRLLIFSETKPFTQQAPSSVFGILDVLQTIQLLI